MASKKKDTKPEAPEAKPEAPAEPPVDAAKVAAELEVIRAQLAAAEAARAEAEAERDEARAAADLIAADRNRAERERDEAREMAENALGTLDMVPGGARPGGFLVARLKTQLNAYVRGGQRWTTEAKRVPLSSLSPAQLEAILSDPHIEAELLG